jgi:hypothetical protein
MSNIPVILKRVVRGMGRLPFSISEIYACLHPSFVASFDYRHEKKSKKDETSCCLLEEFLVRFLMIYG